MLAVMPYKGAEAGAIPDPWRGQAPVLDMDPRVKPEGDSFVQAKGHRRSSTDGALTVSPGELTSPARVVRRGSRGTPRGSPGPRPRYRRRDPSRRGSRHGRQIGRASRRERVCQYV